MDAIVLSCMFAANIEAAHWLYPSRHILVLCETCATPSCISLLPKGSRRSRERSWMQMCLPGWRHERIRNYYVWIRITGTCGGSTGVRMKEVFCSTKHSGRLHKTKSITCLNSSHWVAQKLSPETPECAVCLCKMHLMDPWASSINFVLHIHSTTPVNSMTPSKSHKSMESSPAG